MRKCIKFVIMLVMCLIAFPCFNAHALLYDHGDLTEDEYKYIVKYVGQGNMSWSQEEIYPGCGDTIASASCSSHAMWYMLIKMGFTDPTKKSFHDELEKWRDREVSNRDMYTGFGGAWETNYAGAGWPALYPGVQYNGEYAVDVSNVHTYVMEKMNEGYFCIGLVNYDTSIIAGAGIHLIFFDGESENGKLIIGDSGKEGLTWEDVYINSGAAYGAWIHLFKCSDLDPLECPSIYAADGLGFNEIGDEGSQPKEDYSEEERIQIRRKYEMLEDEYELRGMPVETKLDPKNYVFDTNGGHGLSGVELENIDYIKQTINETKIPFIQVITTGSIIIGYILLTYAILLILAMLFDKVNPFFNFSFVTLLTFGHVKLISKNEREIMSYDGTKSGYKSTIIFCVIVGIVIGIAVLFISGLFIKWVYELVSIIK